MNETTTVYEIPEEHIDEINELHPWLGELLSTIYTNPR